MCGIVAFFGSNLDEDEFKKSLWKISHRGEFQDECLLLEKAFLGANRLALVDAMHGAQPVHNEDKTIFAIQNGEIFNFQELNSVLIKAGHQISSQNDTETLVHLWEEFGTDMVNLLDSEMFAFAIYDKKNNDVFVARDALGVKPLYYAFVKNNFYCASEVKALVDIKGIEIKEFPPGHFYFNGKFQKYFNTQILKNEKIDNFDALLNAAVKKRVQTNLPIAVFLSGGVDSSLIMELATRYHTDVTALILGSPGSADYKAAVQLCAMKNWKYHIVDPAIDYEEELDQLIYFLETYDPNIVRHAFANHILSKFAHERNFKIILTGEGADELFAGYNEFLSLHPSKINKGCRLLLNSMSKGNLMRVDKMAMRHTVETRCPFFDIELIDLAMSIPGENKISDKNVQKTTKFILRTLAEKYLPEDIAWREKVPFANGAGMDVGFNYTKQDGIFSQIAAKNISDVDFFEISNRNPIYKIKTKEEALFLKFYIEHGYDKYIDGRERLIVKDTLHTI